MVAPDDLSAGVAVWEAAKAEAANTLANNMAMSFFMGDLSRELIE